MFVVVPVWMLNGGSRCKTITYAGSKPGGSRLKRVIFCLFIIRISLSRWSKASLPLVHIPKDRPEDVYWAATVLMKIAAQDCVHRVSVLRRQMSKSARFSEWNTFIGHRCRFWVFPCRTTLPSAGQNCVFLLLFILQNLFFFFFWLKPSSNLLCVTEVMEEPCLTSQLNHAKNES